MHTSHPTFAAALLRVALGVMYFTHGAVLKLGLYGMAGTSAYFESLGLPAATAYLVVSAEIIGGILLIAGIGTTVIAAGLIPVLIGATLVHWGNGWVFSNAGGGWEYPVFLIVASIAVAIQGASAPVMAAWRRLWAGEDRVSPRLLMKF